MWAHNSHLGDARATEMAKWGELNLGQLVRESYGNEALSIGFTTYTGTVMAADNWGETGRIMKVRPGLRGSYEDLFHREDRKSLLVPIRGYRENTEFLSEPRLERAIGVIYRPESERTSHYFDARLAQQFDAVIHVDTTRALEAIDHGLEPFRRKRRKPSRPGYDVRRTGPVVASPALRQFGASRPFVDRNLQAIPILASPPPIKRF